MFFVVFFTNLKRYEIMTKKQKGSLRLNNEPFINQIIDYSTVTDFAKLRGWSTSVPLINAT